MTVTHFSIIANGCTRLELPVLHSLGPRNLADVRSHEMCRVASSTSDVVHFFGGSVLRFAYNDHGHLIELLGQGIDTTVQNDGELCVHRHIGSRTASSFDSGD